MATKSATHNYNVIIEWDPIDRVWVTYVPALNYLSTYGETRETALQQTQEAIIGYLEALKKEGLPAPRSDTVELVKLEVALP